jgi:uncharacterized protein (TIGR00730 family)
MEDIEFLHGESARAVRLQLDYLKPEGQLAAHGVRSTVVVFGSTRLVEPAIASARVEQAESALRERPDDPATQREAAVARRLAANSHYYEVAREFSALVAERGRGADGSRPAIVTGGGPGIMEAANRGAFESGAPSIGLNITLPREQYPNPYLTPGLCVQFHYFAIRKLHFLLRARALIAFPGGYGTLDELFETLTLIQTGKHRPIPVVLVGRKFWDRAVDFDFLVDEGVITPADRALVHYAETANDIWQRLSEWYERAGGSLFL